MVLTWWMFAFNFKQASEDYSAVISIPIKQTEYPPVIKYLSPMQRDHLHQALSGDFPLMIKLITDWDHDAQIMKQFGFADVKRLPKNDFLRCQLLARQICRSSKNELDQLHALHRVASVHDDHGHLFDLSKSYRCFLPQSYVAASFLLALTEPETIIALPQGLREHKNIFPIEMTRLIPLDVNRYNAEKLYQVKPEIAFVADYSHPATIQALERQGIPLFTLKHVNSPEDIQHALLRLGHVINRPLKAELLNYFVEAAMQAIDNRFKMLNSSFNAANSSPKVLFLKHHLTFSTPTSNTLTGKLLKRIGVKSLAGDQVAKNMYAWTIPIHQEQILQLDPDYIIISTNHLDLSTQPVVKEPVFRLLANKNKQIRFVEDTIQESPSQYIVLAYYDIFKALTE